MRAIIGACLIGAALFGGSASAEESRSPPEIQFTLEAIAGGNYSFAEDVSFPTVDESSLNSSLSFAVRRGEWSFAVAYLEAKNDEEGQQVTLGFERKRDCFGDSDLGCSISIQARDIEEQETFRYSAGFRRQIDLGDTPNFEPVWVVNALAITGDRQETSLAAGVELPFSFDPRATSTPSGRPDWRWTVTAALSALHGFEAETTLPVWGLRVDYHFTRDVRFSLGYESRAVINEDDPDDLDVDRTATARLRIRFN